MMKKIKISELAKDLNIASKELVEVLQPFCEDILKTNSSLSEKMVNIVLEIYSKKNEVENFDKYFSLIKNRKLKSNSSNLSKDVNYVSLKSQNNSDKQNFEKKVVKLADYSEKSKKSVKVKVNADDSTKNRINRTDVNKLKNNAVATLVNSDKDLKPKKTIKLNSNFNGNVSSSFDTSRQSSRKLIDTRSTQVNLDKYNERYEQMARDSNFNDGVLRRKKFKKSVVNKNLQKKDFKLQKLQQLALEKARNKKLKITIPDEIIVSELASRLKINVAQLMKKLMGLGVMAKINDALDYDTAAVVAQELGAEVEHEVTLTIEERLFEDDFVEDEEANLQKREPIVVVMGHVDHGKTSLLDRICNLDVTASEEGGITQHIGAYKVKTKTGTSVTFLDTPGHEAFTSMRMRGANMTDIAILVIAADDGIMPQTVEAINHAKAANVSIIVAMNKIDKPQSNVEKIKQDLMAHDLVIEECGGDVICVPVSAKTGEGIDQLLEMIDLVAEIKDLKANVKRLAKGVVIEAYLDKGRGPVATLLVQNGTLKLGDSIIAGTSVGHVRTMLNDRGQSVQMAGPSTPVEVTGLSEVPFAGDGFNAIANEKLAKELVEKRKFKQKQEQFANFNKVTLDNLFTQINDGKRREVAIIVKADVQGSVEALKNSFEKLSNEEVKVKVIHGAVGAINKSDVMLAVASNAIVVGFNVRPDAVAKHEAEGNDVDLRRYSVIYDAITELETAIKGMLAPKTKTVELGEAEVRQIYKISNVGTIAGCFISKGKVLRNSQVRVFRDGILIVSDEKIKSLKRFKDDTKEVVSGYECGIGLLKFNDIKVGDVMEFFDVEVYTD